MGYPTRLHATEMREFLTAWNIPGLIIIRECQYHKLENRACLDPPHRINSHPPHSLTRTLTHECTRAPGGLLFLNHQIFRAESNGYFRTRFILNFKGQGAVGYWRHNPPVERTEKENRQFYRGMWVLEV